MIYPRRLNKGGRQFCVKKRRRQGAASRGGNLNMESRETVENKGIMQQQKNQNEKIHIQNEPLSQKSSQSSFKIPRLFEDLSFPVHNVKDDFKPSLQLSFHTIYLANINFAQFDAQFVAMPKSITAHIPNPMSFTNQH